MKKDDANRTVVAPRTMTNKKRIDLCWFPIWKIVKKGLTFKYMNGILNRAIKGIKRFDRRYNALG